MRVLMIGAGGVGGYLGARLASAGADITILARGAHGRALAERGISLETEAGTEHVALPRVVLEQRDLDGEQFDLVLVAVKWRDLEEVCRWLPEVLAPGCFVVPLLNGLESERVVASSVGAARTIAGVAYMSSGILEPGRIYTHGNTRVGLAPFAEGQGEKVEAFAQLFERARVPVHRARDATSMLWQKMVWNAPFNAICALSRVTAGEAVAFCEPLVRAAMAEVIAVAKAEGASLPDTLIDGMISTTLTQFPRTEPSMLQDLRAGKATELEILQGAVVARAKAHGIEVPILEGLASLVRAADRASRS